MEVIKKVKDLFRHRATTVDTARGTEISMLGFIAMVQKLAAK